MRSPIATVMGFADLVKINLERGTMDRVPEYISSIHSTCSHMNNQINRMLMLYRVTNKEIEKKVLNLSILSSEIAGELKIQNPQRTIEFDIEPGLEVEADPVLMRLAFENLLSNAVKYTQYRPETQIQIGYDVNARSPTNRTFFVKDNGIGFDQNQCEKLFRPLGRLHKESEFKGTGLGLVSVAKIVELHQGSIRVESERDCGATFYVTPPA